MAKLEKKISTSSISVPDTDVSVDKLEISDEISNKSLDHELTEFIKKEESIEYTEVYPGAERLNYDFVVERRTFESTNFKEATCHLIRGCLGAGLFGIHEAYMRGGLWTSTVVTIFLVLLSAYYMYVLIKSAQILYALIRVPKLSYPDVAEVALATGPMVKWRKYSKWFRHTVNMFLYLNLFGTCCVYEIMIASTVKSCFEAMSNTIENWNLSLRIYILILAVPLMGLCLIKTLKYLAILSVVSSIYVGVIVACTVYFSTSKTEQISNLASFKDVSGFFYMCGACIYSVEGICVALPIENNMKRPKAFSVVVQFAMLFVAVAVITMGFLGYWKWGEKCVSPITTHLPAGITTIIIQLFLAIMLSFSFAMHFWVPFKIMWYYRVKKYRGRRKRKGWLEYVYRVVDVVLITCISIAFPYTSGFMCFLGAVFISFTALIFPAFIHILVTWRHHRVRWRLIPDIVVMFIGFTICIGGLYSLVMLFF